MTRDYSQPYGVASKGVDGHPSNLIAGCFGDGIGGVAAAMGNARLIAAAPDLLLTCETALDCLSMHWDNESARNVVRMMLSAAIAQATQS